MPRPPSLHTRGRGLRGPALQPQAVRGAATQRRARVKGRLPGSAATCPGQPRALGAAGGRGAGRRPPHSSLAGPAGAPRSRARDRRARDWPGRRARELLPGGGLLAPSFWIHLLLPHLLPLPSRGTLRGEEFSVCSHPAPGAKLEEEDGPGQGWCSPGPLQPGHPLALSSPHPDAGHTTPAASRAPLRERAHPCSCLPDRAAERLGAASGTERRWLGFPHAPVTS